MKRAVVGIVKKGDRFLILSKRVGEGKTPQEELKTEMIEKANLFGDNPVLIDTELRGDILFQTFVFSVVRGEGNNIEYKRDEDITNPYIRKVLRSNKFI